MKNILKRLITNASRLDVSIALLLALSVFALYVQTLVPSILDGDQGEFQYMPAALGISHPTGFPLYILLGHLWSLFPIGSLAYRMNLFSAILGTLTVSVLFFALRRQNLRNLAALGASLTLAVIPPFWQYSTVAAVYTLHMFIAVLLFSFLAAWESTRQTKWLQWAVLAFGFGISNHPTFLFFAPATALFVVLVGGRSVTQFRMYLGSAVLVILPLLLYVYFPLRALQLISQNFILPGWSIEKAQGLVSPFYEANPMGVLQFMTSWGLTKNITSFLKWDTLVFDWSVIVLETINWVTLSTAFVGIIALLKRRVKLTLWLVVVVLTSSLVTLQYGYALVGVGHFSPYYREYFLPCFFALILFSAWGVGALLRSIPAFLSRFKFPPVIASAIALVLVSILLIASWQGLITRHSNFWIERSAEIQAKWETIKKYPPEDGAALVGHWGDLTPLWYLQNAEGWRRDIVTLYPPVDEQIDAWLAKGKPLYLVGSLLGWAPEIAKNKYLIPWGALVRVSDRELNSSSPLAHPASLTFQDNHPTIRMLGYDVQEGGGTLDIAVYWEILDNIPLDNYLVYFSLSVPNVAPKSQGDVLVVNWYPTGKLLAGRRALGTYRYQILKEIPSGTYALNLFVYSIDSAKNLDIIEIKGTITELGAINVQ